MHRIRGAGGAAALGPVQQQLAAAAAADRLGGLDLACSPACSASAADEAADAFAAAPELRAYGHDARVFDLAFHPASPDLLVSASDDCSAGVWRRQPGGGGGGERYMQVAAFRGHGDSVMRAAWSPDGQLIATGSSDGMACLWRPREEALTARLNLGAAGTQQLGTLEGHPEEVYACLFLQPPFGSGSGSAAAPQRLLTASGEALFLWDVTTQRLLHQGTPPPPPAAAGPGAGEHQVPERWRPGYLFGVAAQPDGPLLGAACSDGRLRLWTRQGGDSALAPLCTLPWNQAMGADCAWGRNGLFCAVAKDGSVIMMDMRQGTCLQHLQLDTPLLSCSLLPCSGGGHCMVAAGADGGVHFVDVATGEASSLYPEAAPERPLLCASLSADGTALAASGESLVLGELDLPAAELSAASSSGGGGTAGHTPARKWSPITVWRRPTAPT